MSSTSTSTHTNFLFTAIATLLFLTKPTIIQSSPLRLETSTISAAPSFLPSVPNFSSFPPALSPDIAPLLPTPGDGSGVAPTGAMPTIPSSPSPPNPDSLEPNSAITPSGSFAAVSGASCCLSKLGGMSEAVVCGLVIFWWL